MRIDVDFPSKGERCRGWFYEPGEASSPGPALVMAHGFSALKEHYLDNFAAAFCAAGLRVLVFDYRFLGASDGEPRQQVLPIEQQDDFRAALAWLSARDGVDASRIGIWGTSYSGGHALTLAALDPRIAAVVAVVPYLGGTATLRNLAPTLELMLPALAEEHAARTAGAASAMIPVVAPEGEPALLATPESYDWFSAAADIVPAWRNEVTLESAMRMLDFHPRVVVPLISPKPLLVQAAEKDSLIPIEVVREAFAAAGEPKKLESYDCGHFGLYNDERLHPRVLASATDWFVTHLHA